MKPKYEIALIAAAWLTLPMTAHSAFAVTAEGARKCNALTAKAFPPRVPGNPAAGLTHGTGREAQEYFKKCVGGGGSM